MNREWAHEVDQQLRELFQRTRSRSRVRGGGSGGGSAGWAPIERESPDLLPDDVPDSSLGYITAGEYEGAWFSKLDGVWRGLNFWEIPVVEEEE